MTSLNDVESAIYSTSIVYNAINDCKELFHMIGHPAYNRKILVLDVHDVGSCDDLCDQDPAQSASTYHSNPLVRSGVNVNP